ncbi:hypothetical protein [Moraxella bovoculi]|uniref:hypothetical protein n=1 Tax=Moraxella bovoculi TaxID=386891 RepID=UPI000624A690|nr:hypothetical protein [Moraxella bovoculi]AKG15598.2 hypothetical protein AAX08_06395 [Moraxella bovoculi]
MSRDAKRKKRKIAKRNNELQAIERKRLHERKIQQELGTELYGYWQSPLDGHTAAQMYQRSTWYGDWDIRNPPKGERRFIVSMFLYSAADKAKDRQLDLTDLEMTCEFMDLSAAISQHVREVEVENPHIKIDGWRSFVRVRT